MCVNRSKICLSFTASSVSFILETAVMCNYWYVFHVLLNSAPRYINAMRPGSHFSLALFTSMTVLHRRKPDEERQKERERENRRKKAIRAKSLQASVWFPRPFNSRLTFLPFQRPDTTSSGKLLLLRWYSRSLKYRVLPFSLFAVLFHYHQSELLRFPVSHLVGNYGGVRVELCQVRWSSGSGWV